LGYPQSVQGNSDTGKDSRIFIIIKESLIPFSLDYGDGLQLPGCSEGPLSLSQASPCPQRLPYIGPQSGSVAGKALWMQGWRRWLVRNSPIWQGVPLLTHNVIVLGAWRLLSNQFRHVDGGLPPAVKSVPHPLGKKTPCRFLRAHAGKSICKVQKKWL